MTPPVVDVTSGGVLGILAGVLTLIGMAFALWKKKSSTHVSVTEDSSRIGWIGDLDARMRLMQSQMDDLAGKERRTHDLHQECIRLSDRLTERVNRQDVELSRLRGLLFAVRPELRDVFGGTSAPAPLAP